MAPHLEVAVFSLASALLAESQGVGRIELNAPNSYAAGGTTPPLDVFSSLSSQTTIPIRIMIRPRGPPASGSPDFLYTEDEFANMKAAIRSFLDSGRLNLSRGDGFVFGILKKTGDTELEVDVERCSELTQLSQPFPCVFHRAFDPIAATSKWSAGLADIETAGFRGLLTSGGLGSMGGNMPRLRDIAHTTQQKIELVAGGGLRSQTFGPEVADLFARHQPSVWLHTAALAKDDSGRALEEVDPIELDALLAKLRA